MEDDLKDFFIQDYPYTIKETVYVCSKHGDIKSTETVRISLPPTKDKTFCLHCILELLEKNLEEVKVKELNNE